MLINKSDPKQHDRDRGTDNAIVSDTKLSTKDDEIQPDFRPIKQIPDKPKTYTRFSPLHRQSMAIFGPIMTVITAGLVTGFSAILLPKLKQPDTKIVITHEEASWIASMAALPMVFGCFIGGYMMERFGRRMTHLISSVPMVLGWAIISLAPNLWVILLGRFITGLCVGVTGAPGSVYIGEVSEPRYRGVFLSFISLGISLGILISHILGTFLSWELTAIISALFPLVCYVAFKFVPESPAWLLSKGELDRAERAFIWLRGDSVEALTEFQTMVDKQLKSFDEKHNEVKKSVLVELKTNLSNPVFIQPLVIMLLFFATLQFSGVNAVTFYTIDILKDTLQDGINEYLAMIIIDIVRLIMSVLSCVLIKKLGRRELSIIGAGGTAASLLVLAGSVLLIDNIGSSAYLFWLPLASLLGFITFSSIGLVPLPWCMIGEIFPLAQRGLGTGIVSAWNFLLFFIVVKTSPALFLYVHKSGTFFIYGIFALLGALYIYWRLPETKNKTLQQIEDEFRRKAKPTTQNQEENVTPNV